MDLDTPRFNLRVLRGESRADWATRFYQAAARTKRLFRSEGAGLLYIDPGSGPRRLLTEREFYGAAHSVVEVGTLKKQDDDTEAWVTLSMDYDDVQILFSHPAKTELDVVRAVVSDPAVIPTGGTGEFRLIEPGFNSPAGIYYFCPPFRAPIRPRDGAVHLTKCFSGVPFEEPRHRANLMAWLLGAVCLDARVNPPLLVVTGNTQNIGKTSCVQAAGHIITGGDPAPISCRGGDEFGKQLSSRFVENERIIFLDNIVTPQGKSFDNPALSQLLTQGFSKKVRILGHSRSVSASGVLFAASLNDARLSTDLATRALVVKLYLERPVKMTPYCLDYARDNREALYGELLGLALQTKPGVGDRFQEFRFCGWLNFTHPRITPLFGDLGLNEAQTIDDITQELAAFGFEKGDAAFTAAEFLAEIRRNEATYSALNGRFMSILSEKNRTVSVGKFLAGRAGEQFRVNLESTIRLVKLATSANHAAEYKFEVVT